MIDFNTVLLPYAQEYKQHLDMGASQILTQTDARCARLELLGSYKAFACTKLKFKWIGQTYSSFRTHAADDNG